MTFDIEVGGRRRRVSIDPLGHPDHFRFTVDGDVIETNAVRVDAAAWSLLLADGSQHLVSVSGTRQSGFIAHVAGADIAVTVPAAGRMSRGGGAEASRDTTVPARIVAPMPGKVVRILAAVGQEVTAGQGIVVVEAMKMENELRTPRAGVVQQIAAAEGSTVDAGTLLAVVG